MRATYWKGEKLVTCAIRLTGWNGCSDSESRAIVIHTGAQSVLWFRALSVSLSSQGDVNVVANVLR